MEWRTFQIDIEQGIIKLYVYEGKFNYCHIMNQHVSYA